MAEANGEAAGTRRQVESIYADATDGGGDSKRAKSGEEPGLDFDNLPDALLKKILGYLPDEITRALLAVALTAPSSSWRRSGWKVEPTTTAVNILSFDIVYGGYIDFSDVDVNLAARLSDEDVGAVLVCTGARQNGEGEAQPLTTVALTHCVSVRGYGLEPLRNSVHLKELDLRFIRKKDKRVTVNLDGALSEADTIPVLERIIDADGCSMTNVHFPQKWRVEQSQPFRQFLTKFGDMLDRRKVTCCQQKHRPDGESWEYFTCGKSCNGTAERPWFSQSGDDFGTHNFTCFGCNESYCNDCAEDSYPNKLCKKCDKKYCIECSETLKCFYCQKTTCYECTMIRECDSCGRVSCGDCEPVFACDCGESKCTGCVPFDFCDYSGCNWSNCRDCGDAESDCVKTCYDCGGTYCPDHIMLMHVKIGDRPHCSDCNERAASKLVEYNGHFERWVTILEARYGDAGRSLSSSNDFREALQVREQLRQRCNAVGDKLSLKHKQYERFDHWLGKYEKPLALDNTHGGYGRYEYWSAGWH